MMQEGNNAYNFNTPLGLQNNNNESHSPSTADTLLSPFNLSNPSTLSNKVKISYQADAPKNDCDQLSNYFQKINIQENQNKKNSIDFNFNFDENISDFNTDDYFHNDNETLSSSSSRKTTSENVEQIIQDSFFCSSNPLNFSKKNKKKSDRFIPNRTTSKLDIALTSAHEMDENYYFQKNDPDRLKGKDINENNQLSFADIYKSQILGITNKKICSSEIEEEEAHQDLENQNIFRFQPHLPQKPQNPAELSSNIFFDSNEIVSKYQQKKKQTRKIAKIPFKVLDAPQLQDDYYLNLIDWGSQNQLSVALSSCVYLWNASNNKVSKFCDLGPQDMVTSVQWNPGGTHLAVGTSFGEVEIWDANKMKKLTSLQGHNARVGSLAWGDSLLASGSRDKSIIQRDTRVWEKQGIVSKLLGHKQEVCGLKWSFDGQQLASGGNDNKLMVWNLHSSQYVSKFSNHCAAVKALAWSPHQHSLLASGGGTADRTIRFWNTHTSQQINHIDTGSQVCNLMFGKNNKELVSTHGYSMNQICVWKYPTMEKIQDLYGHTSRVLFLAASPDGETLVSGAGDETLRFWKIFPSQKKVSTHQSSLLAANTRALR